MRAPTVERMISIMASVLLMNIGFLVPKAAFDNKQLPDLENPLSFRGSQP
jgi:hypothetical protein